MRTDFQKVTVLDVCCYRLSGEKGSQAWDMGTDSYHLNTDTDAEEDGRKAEEARTDVQGSWEGNEVHLEVLLLVACHMEDKDDSSLVEACHDHRLYLQILGPCSTIKKRKIVSHEVLIQPNNSTQKQCL